MTQTNITVIGCGKMGSALLKGWITAFPDYSFGAIDPNTIPNAINNKIKTATKTEDLSEFITSSSLIVLAVKPQIMAEACAELKPFITPNTLILSIAAGQSIENFESYFSPTQPIIRTMPNTPAAIGKGMIVGVTNKHVSNEQKDLANTLLRATGQVEWLEDEMLLNAVTALSGSGPAYIFHLIETLTQAGIEIGLEKTLSESLARQTIIGSAALAEDQAGTPASTLRKNVTSPGGTTEAALKILMDGRVQDIYNEALQAARKRGEELN